MRRMLYWLLVVCVAIASHAAPSHAQTAHLPGYLVIAPDRGFLGNEEVRDAFAAYRTRFTAALAVVTENQTDRFLKEALGELERAKAAKVVVVPLFLSDAHPLYKKAVAALQRQGSTALTRLPVTIAKPMAGHYLTAEILADRLTGLSQKPPQEALVLVATGATTADEAKAMAQSLELVASQVAERFPFARRTAVALGHHRNEALAEQTWKQLEQALSDAKGQNLRPVIVPLDLTTKYDSMMTFSAQLQGLAKRHGGVSTAADLTPHPNVALWLANQSNAHYPVSAKEVGIVFMPHGAGYEWNRQMLDTIAPLQGKYLIEPAFSMADPALMERAVRRLEARGARQIVVLRVYSLASSFREVTEYVLGLRHQLGHAGHGPMPLPARIRSGCVLTTVGGVEASPYFAEALLDRAIGLSQDPAKETVILMAHGTDDEAQNQHWLANLGKLADQMRASAKQRGKAFKDIRYLTWREDWAHLSQPEITKARDLVAAAAQNGGRAIVIPARTNGAGHEDRWLKGLSFAFDGQGFAPHPRFVDWVESQIKEALKAPVQPAAVPAAPAHGGHQHHHHH